jgi:hypothetical protein
LGLALVVMCWILCTGFLIQCCVTAEDLVWKIQVQYSLCARLSVLLSKKLNIVWFIVKFKFLVLALRLHFALILGTNFRSEVDIFKSWGLQPPTVGADSRRWTVHLLICRCWIQFRCSAVDTISEQNWKHWNILCSPWVHALRAVVTI